MVAVVLLAWSIAGSAAASSGAASAAAAPPPDAAAIIALAAAEPGDRVAFTERRSNELLSEPMVLEGHVTLQDDGTLVRVVERPFEETATINGDQASISRDGRVRRIDLHRHRRAGAYLETLYALLRGDAAALKERFDMQVAGDRADWQLLLTPSDRTLSRQLARIVVVGSADRIRRVRMERKSGAWQEMQLEQDVP